MKTVLLGDVCDFQGGAQPPKNDFIYEKRNGYVRFLQIRDFKKPIQPTYIPVSKKNRLCEDEDILIGRYGASVGNILTGMSGAYNVAMMKITPKRGLDKKFLYIYLLSKLFQEPLSKISARSAQAGFSKEDIYSFEIPLPGLEEQGRIVKKLDEVFAAIDKAKENTEKNLKNVQELFESALQGTFSKPEDSWTKGTLDTFCILQRGHDLPKAQRIPGQYPLASSSGIIDTHNVAKSKGPGVYTGRSGSVGNIFYVEEDYWPLNTVLYVKEFFGNEPKLIYYLIKSLNFIEYAGGTGVPTLNRNVVHQISVSLPPKAQQKELSGKLDKLSTQTQKLQKLYQQKLNNLEELRQSYLHHAFTSNM